MVHRQTAELLGRRVAERPEDRARLCAFRHSRQVRAAGSGTFFDGLREAEVEDLDPAVPRHEEVLGLEVPVDNALLVRGS